MCTENIEPKGRKGVARKGVAVYVHSDLLFDELCPHANRYSENVEITWVEIKPFSLSIGAQSVIHSCVLTPAQTT